MTPLEQLLKKPEGLRPCPHCPNKHIDSWEALNSHYIGCGVCQLTYGGVFTGPLAKELTERHWNHRPMEDALREACGVFVEALEEITGYPNPAMNGMQLKAAKALFRAEKIAASALTQGADKLQWQSPTDWSMETVDGTYYIEQADNTGRFNAYARSSRPRCLGDFVTAECAKAFCEAHAAQENAPGHKEEERGA